MDKNKGGDPVNDFLNGRSASDDPKNPDNKQKNDAGGDQTPRYDFNGKQLTGEELAAEATRQRAEYTRATTELAELKKKQTASQDPSDQEDLERQLVKRDMKKKYNVAYEEDIDKRFADKSAEIVSQATKSALSQLNFNQQLDQIETMFNGEDDANGIKKPKVTREEIIGYATKHNVMLPPLEIVKLMKHDEIVDYQAQLKALNPITGKQDRLPGANGGGGRMDNPPAPKPLDLDDGSLASALREDLKSVPII